MSKKILVCIANGSEEIEATVPIDILRRAAGDQTHLTVATVSDDPETLMITASNGSLLVGQKHISQVTDEEFDLIVIPGGVGGSQACAACEPLIDMLRAQKDSGRLYAAICAAPALVLADNGLLDGVTCCTCYPHEPFRSKLPSLDHADELVCVDGNCVTSQAPGTAIYFALKLAELLYGVEKADEIRTAIRLPQ